MKKKIDAVLRIDRPCTSPRFIGCVNYYRDVRPRHAHVLQPRTDQSRLKKGAPIQWTDAHQHAFDKIRCHIAAYSVSTIDYDGIVHSFIHFQHMKLYSV